MDSGERVLKKAYIGITVFVFMVMLASIVFVPHSFFHGMFHVPGQENSGAIDVGKFTKALGLGR